jgi:hypothetical protein
MSAASRDFEPDGDAREDGRSLANLATVLVVQELRHP